MEQQNGVREVERGEGRAVREAGAYERERKI